MFCGHYVPLSGIDWERTVGNKQSDSVLGLSAFITAPTVRSQATHLERQERSKDFTRHHTPRVWRGTTVYDLGFMPHTSALHT